MLTIGIARDTTTTPMLIIGGNNYEHATNAQYLIIAGGMPAVEQLYLLEKLLIEAGINYNVEHE